MRIRSGSFARYLEQAGFRPLSAYRAREIVALILAIAPPVITACLVGNPDRWELFGRSGYATSAVGLFWASRRYVAYSVLELARLRTDVEADSTLALREIFTAKLGLAISAFGMIISGWGDYLRWWSFSFLIVWALFVARDVYRDLARPAEAQPPISTGDSPKVEADEDRNGGRRG